MAKRKSTNRIFTFGLVGGIASGKSHVASRLEALGAVRIDADQIAHEVLKRPMVIRRLSQVFGDDILDADGLISRKMLAKIVFGQSPQATQARKQLEEIVHPQIHASAVQELQRLNSTEPRPVAAVIDAPLLLEADWAPMCDAILFVDSSKETRRERAKQRGWSSEELDSREAAQLDLDRKRRAATHIIPGDGATEELDRRLNRLLEEIKRVDSEA